MLINTPNGAQVPLAQLADLRLAIIFVLFYFTFSFIAETLMVMLGVPVSLVGGLWYMAFLGYHMSIAVWMGIIALVGMVAETSAVMLAYLDEACRRQREAGRLKTLQDLLDTVYHRAVEHIRPMAMAGLANILGLLPVMWASDTGADVMKCLAAPMVGGVFSALRCPVIGTGLQDSG